MGNRIGQESALLLNPVSPNQPTPTLDPHVREVIRSAEAELHELLGRRAEVMKRIGTIKQTLCGLAKLFGDAVLSEELRAFLDRGTDSRQLGFTHACRSILIGSKKALTARQVCLELERAFPELLRRHKEPLASVTTVLTRLVAYAEAHCFLNERGRRVWSWISEEGGETPSVRREEADISQCVYG